jgi:hypothetical protein
VIDRESNSAAQDQERVGFVIGVSIWLEFGLNGVGWRMAASLAVNVSAYAAKPITSRISPAYGIGFHTVVSLERSAAFHR